MEVKPRKIGSSHQIVPEEFLEAETGYPLLWLGAGGADFQGVG
jgi:hypothetical protein